jgi:multiple sugar transport system substrate-binding protein
MISRRRFLHAGTATAAVLLLAACSSPSRPATPAGGQATPSGGTAASSQNATPAQAAAGAKAPVTITYSEWEITEAQLNFHKAVVKRFNDEHPDIKVDMQQSQLDKVETQIVAGTATDVVHQYKSYIFGPKGKLIDLNPYIQSDKEVMDHHLAPTVLDLYRVKGKTYAFARAISTGPLNFFNKNLFDEAKVAYPTNDWTWEQYEEAALKLTKKEGDRITQFGTDDLVGMIQNLAAANGVKNGFWDLDGQKLLMGDPGCREAANWAWKFTTQYKITPDQTTYKELGGFWQMFQTGKLAQSMSAIWVLTPYQTIKSFQWDGVMNMKRKERAGWLIMYPLSITPTCKNPDAAYQFLRFYATKEGSELVVQYNYGLPVWKELVSDLKGPLATAAELIQEGGRIINKPYEHTDEFTNKEINPRWDKVRNGQMTVDKAIDELVAAWPKYVPAS